MWWTRRCLRWWTWLVGLCSAVMWRECDFGSMSHKTYGKRWIAQSVEGNGAADGGQEAGHGGAAAVAAAAGAEILVIYNADGTLAGELRYLMRKWFLHAHCSACAITHGARVEKPEWVALKRGAHGWGAHVSVRNIHRDEMDAELRATVRDDLPCVVARGQQRTPVVLLRPEDLERCHGDVRQFQRQLGDRLIQSGYAVPTATGGMTC